MSARLVALTGYGQSHDKTRAMQSGFDQHLTKPASLDSVLSIVADAPKSKRLGPAE